MTVIDKFKQKEKKKKVKIPRFMGVFSNFKFHKEDLISAISLSFVAVPQALAYAALAGVPIHYGLYAASIPTFLAALLGTSKVLFTGPAAAISILTAGLISQYGLSDPALILAYTSTLALLVGLIQILLGITKMGTIINFIAKPVIMGFTTAAAIVIAFSQIPYLFGLSVEKHSHFYQDVFEIVTKFQSISLETSIFGIVGIIIIVLTTKRFPVFPATLLVVLVSIVLSWLIGYEGKIIGDLPKGVPSLNFKDLFNLPLISMIPSATIIAIVGFVEGITVIKSLSQKTRDHVDPNHELIAQGTANISSGLLGAFPVAGSLSKTALSHTLGTKTKMAAMIVGIITLIVAIGFADIFYYLPYATLAAIIISAVFGIVHVDKFKKLIKSRPREGAVAIITVITSLYFAPHLDYGIIVGIIASVIAYLHRNAHPNIQIFFCHDKDYLHSHGFQIRTYPTNKKVMGVTVDASLTFANATYVYDKIMKSLKIKKKPKYVLILCSKINNIDASAEEILIDLYSDLKDMGITLLLSGLQEHVIREMKVTKVYDFIGGENIYPRTSIALKAIYATETK